MSIQCNIIVGVTGGIAAYKAPILIRRLREQGADVRVVMTNGAKHFITPLTLQAVSGHQVRDTLLDAEAESGMDHIDLARWADKVIIAPASADFIAKLAHGLADDLLTTLCLATTAPIYIASAMNHQMWQNQATQDNLAVISKRGIKLLGPDSGDQACGETGPGRMLEPSAIIEALASQIKPITNTDSAPNKPKILITAGPTWEALDPVRGLTNHSSGKMGYSIAAAFANKKFPTTLISGPTALAKPANVDFVSVQSAQDMYQAVHAHIEQTDIFISVAAVADYRPELVADQKIKKNNDELHVKLIRNPDILQSVTQLAQPPFAVGFAAETNDVADYAKQKLKNKNLDMIIANEVGHGKAFGQDENQLLVIDNNQMLNIGPDSKTNLSSQLVSIITNQYEQKNSTQNS